MRPIGRDARTARLAVSAAALALAGLLLAAGARLSAGGALDEARATTAAQAGRLGGMIGGAIAAARARADELAATPAVREILYTDESTAIAEGFVLPAAAHGETFELFQLARRRLPRSLHRTPEAAAPLAIARANDVRLEQRDGVLAVTAAQPAQPMYPREGVHGAVAVATHVDLTPIAESLRARGLAVELVGVGAPLPLTSWPDGDAAARAQSVSVPLPPIDGVSAKLALRAHVRSGGGGALWAGRVLLLAAFAAALSTFVVFRRRTMPPLDDAPTERRRHTPPAMSGIPARPLDLGPTAREKRAEPWRPTPTPITQLRPSLESAPIVVDPRGDRLAGRYRLLRPLGRGHAADVYLAQSFVPGAPATVALKLLGGADSAARRAYLAMARRQASLTDEHVAAVLDVGDGEVPFVAMEYIEGCTLAAVLRELGGRDQALPLPPAMAVVAAVCHALDAARPLAHGAIKPSNVLVGRHGAIKLADFGAPVVASECGSPEQYAGKPADRRSDVFAIGVLLHQLVTGRRLAPAAPGADGAWPPLPAPSTIRPALPRTLDAVVAKATRFGPRGRYASAGDLLAALHGAAPGAIAASSSVRIGDWVDRARRS